MDHFFASAVNCPVDSQGRMVLSDELCRFAGIEKEKEVVLAGSGAKFDIWNPGGVAATAGGRCGDLRDHPEEPRAMTCEIPFYPNDLC